MILETIAAIAEYLLFQFLCPANRLLTLFVLIDFLLQSDQHFNIVQVIKFFRLIVEYFHV